MSKNTTRLRILATSDVHMRMMGFDYFTDAPAPGVGLSALGATLTRLRDDPARDCVLLDNGDLIQGTPLADTLAADPAARTAFAQTLETLGYSALGVGNHDLDYGLDHLSAVARATRIPMISSNMTVPKPGDWLQPSALIPCGDVTLGLVSVLPPRTLDWAHAILENDVAISDMADAVVHAAQQARANGADIIVALAHTGLGDDPLENGLSAIAATGAVDILIGGHTHEVFPSPAHATRPEVDVKRATLHGIPTIMPGFGGAFVGCFDIDLSHTTTAGWSILKTSVSLEPAAPDGPLCSPALTGLMPAHEKTRANLDATVGAANVALHSYFTHLKPPPMLCVTGDAQRHAIHEARRGTAYETLPLLSAVSASRAGGRGGPGNYSDVPAGVVKARHLADLDVFANMVWAVQMSGAEVQDWLEMAACAFYQTGTSDTLVNPAFPPFYFDVISGLTYQIDPSQPCRFDVTGALCNPDATRVSDLRHKDTLVQPDDQFLIAVNSYRASGGGNFPGLHTTRPVLRPKLDATEALRRYFASGQNTVWPPAWRFADAVRGYSCQYETGPGALAHLDAIADLSPGTPKREPNGFVSIPVTL